jgi:hypothetical protein
MLHYAMVFSVVVLIAALVVAGLLAEIGWFFGSLARRSRRRGTHCPAPHSAS